MAKTIRRTLSQEPVKLLLLSSEILLQVSTWKRSLCDGYIFLLEDGQELANHASVNHIQAVPYQPGRYPPPLWNFRAYCILLFTAIDTDHLATNLVSLYNFQKTDNLLILKPSKTHLLAWTHFLYKGSQNLTFLDSWAKGKFLQGKNFFPSKLNDLQGAVLKVATFEHPPSVVYEYDDHNNILKRLGVDMEIMQGLAMAKNFSIEFKEVDEEIKWGSKYPNGTWDGLMGEVMYETSDIGVCNVFNEHFRWNDVDFSYPYNFMPGCFVAPSPKPVLNWQSPILPFKGNTWASVFGFLIVGGTFLYIVSAFSIKKESSAFRNVFNNYLYILSSLTTGSVTIVPSHGPTRIYVGCVWICCLIISTAYSANLVAFLSVTKVAEPIDTVKQLASSGLRFGAHAFWKTQFDGSPDPSVNKIFNALETDMDIHDLFEKVEEGKFALIENRQYLELHRDARFTYGDTATIRIGSECFSQYSISLILNKNSPLTYNLAYDLLCIFESGMMNKWQQDVVKFYRKQYEGKRKLLASKDVTYGTKALTLSQLQGVFYILGFGYLLTSCILVLEVIIKPTQ